MELDIGDAALLVQQRVRVHAKALHVAVVERHADIVLQERKLRPPTSRTSVAHPPHWHGVEHKWLAP